MKTAPWDHRWLSCPSSIWKQSFLLQGRIWFQIIFYFLNKCSSVFPFSWFVRETQTPLGILPSRNQEILEKLETAQKKEEGETPRL